MKSMLVPFRSMCLALLVCATLAGCGNPYPHYASEGSTEGRQVVVYLNKKGDKIKVAAGTALGGIPDEAREELATKGEATWEDKGVKVTVVTNGAALGIKNVEYKGKKVPLKNDL